MFVKNIKAGLSGLAVLFFILSGLVFSCKSTDTSLYAVGVLVGGHSVQYMYYGDLAMWKHIFERKGEYVIPKAAPLSIMLPHHDITTFRQKSYYQALSKEIQPSVIVIICPDHFEKGNNLINLPNEIEFETPDGNLNPDKELIEAIKNNSEINSAVSLQDDLWKGEHGIFIHTPFLKHYFPSARFVPIAVKPLSTDEEFEYFKKLGKVLSELLPEDALLIASVDCSHYQIPKVTAFHDEVTINTIFNREDPRFAEIDSPESVQVIYSYNQSRKADQTVLIDHSSTYDYIPEEMVVSTSHLYLAFYENTKTAEINNFYESAKTTSQRYRKPDNNLKQTILIAGSGKTGAGIRKTWKWDRYQNSTDMAERLLYKTAGTEARFLYGFDAVIFDPEPGTVYENTVHNTTLKVQTVNEADFKKGLKVNPIQSEKCINILEVVLEENTVPETEEIIYLFKSFDAVVFRDNKGQTDAILYCRKSKNNTENIQKINLGICRGKGKIKGAVALINFDGEKIEILTLDYEGKKGIIPAIHQYSDE